MVGVNADLVSSRSSSSLAKARNSTRQETQRRCLTDVLEEDEGRATTDNSKLGASNVRTRREEWGKPCWMSVRLATSL